MAVAFTCSLASSVRVRRCQTVGGTLFENKKSYRNDAFDQSDEIDEIDKGRLFQKLLTTLNVVMYELLMDSLITLIVGWKSGATDEA